MILFKYVRPERIDVIDKCELRFTQPGALNDPFELRPRFESLVHEAEILDSLATTPVDLGPVLVQAYGMLTEDQRARIPFESARQAVSAFMATPLARSAASAGVRTCLRAMKDGAASARQELYRGLSENVGILSLSEVPNHALMWAHYADSHRGMVLAFDSTHTFFRGRRSDNDEFHFLRKVFYSDAPSAPSITSLDGDEVFVTKGQQWAYEQEWRILAPLAEASRLLSIPGDTVHLFAFPSDALRAVVLGANASSAFEGAVRELVALNRNLGHVEVHRAMLDLDRQSVRVPALGGA